MELESDRSDVQPTSGVDPQSDRAGNARLPIVARTGLSGRIVRGGLVPGGTIAERTADRLRRALARIR